MENIYEKSLRLISEGSGFSVDFKKRSLRINGEDIISDGIYQGELGVKDSTIDDVLNNIEDLYAWYKHSIPSEASERKRQNYFVALKMNDLSDEDMWFGYRRDVAQAKLEIYILMNIINGSLTWDEGRMGRWFWQSEKDKDLVILRDWVE